MNNIWKKTTCDLCGKTFYLPDDCECWENLREHAKASAVRACANGLWNGYDGDCSPADYINNDSPSIEDAQDLIRRYGRQTSKQIAAWKKEWKIACVEWYLQGEDYKSICAQCGKELEGKELLTGYCEECFTQPLF